MNAHPPSSQSPTRTLGLDLRSLGLFRMGLALVILYDLADRARDLSAHYTDSGILPLVPFKAQFAESYFWSLNFISDAGWFQATLFGLATLAALALLLGYRTRAATFFCWVLICSIQMRNPLILQFGDVVLRLWLFWGLFLPLGATFSLDRRRFGAPAQFSWFGGASVAFLLQLAFIYWFTAVLKTGPDWWAEGTAVYYALRYETLAKPLGLFLSQFPRGLQGATYFTLILEIVGPIFIFIPWKNGPLRCLAVALMIAFHLGLAMTLHLGIFPAVCIVGWLAVLPAWFWRHFPAVRSQRELAMADLGPEPIPVKNPWQPSTAASAIAIFLIAYILLWNVRTVQFNWIASWFPYRANLLGEVLRLEQRWGMYAPQPSKTGGWYVIPATLDNGSQVDLYRLGSALTWQQPKNIAKTFPNDRWGNYLTRLWDENFSEYRDRYVTYLLAEYENHFPGGPEIQSLQWVQMRQVTEAFPHDPSLKKIVFFEKVLSDNRD